MTIKEFEILLREEKELYLGSDPKRIKQLKKSRNKRYIIWSYLESFRKCQYWRDVRTDSSASLLEKRRAKFFFRKYDKKRNILSECYGVEIGINSVIGKNIDIWHGGIVINGIIGDNCVFHGNNIIGNKGKGRECESPKIGNGVDIGAGANIIGKLKFADNCIVGSSAVVTKSVDQEGAVLVGVPARIISIREDS